MRFWWMLFLVWGTAGLRAADPAADIVRVHLEAMGGRQRIDALKALRAIGAVETGGKRVHFTLIAARPDRVRLETENGQRTLVQASDGVEPPWEFDTGAWPPIYRQMNETVAKTFVADAEFDDPLVAGDVRGFSIDYAGETERDGKRLLRVLVTRKLTETFSLLVDPDTYLIMFRVEDRGSVTGRRMEIATRYDDFRPVNGVLYPYVVSTIIDGKLTQRIEVEAVDANPMLNAETFTRPRGSVAPLRK